MKQKLLSWFVFAMGLTVSGNAVATLYDRDHGMVYDSDQDITWLLDANYADTSGHERGGAMTWQAAREWVDNLIYDGLDDWRLPRVIDTGELGCDWANQGTDCGSNVDVKSSELAYMFHVNLGNQSLWSPDGERQCELGGSFCLVNTSADGVQFENIKRAFSYWTDTGYAPGPEAGAWAFSPRWGFQDNFPRDSKFFVWPVREGDVPEKDSGSTARDTPIMTAEKEALIEAELNGLEFSVEEIASWATGYCGYIKVTNTTDEMKFSPFGVHFTLPEDTRFTEVWPGDVSRNGEHVTVIYPDWTLPINPGEQDMKPLGFCTAGLSKPVDFSHFIPDFSKVEVDFVVTSSWDKGYCGEFSFTYKGSGLYSVHPNTMGFTLPATTMVTESWNGSFKADKERFTVDLPYWAPHLNPDTQKAFTGLCAIGKDLPDHLDIH